MNRDRAARILTRACWASVAAGMAAATGFAIALIVITAVADRYRWDSPYPQEINYAITLVILVLVASAITFTAAGASLICMNLSARLGRKRQDSNHSPRSDPPMGLREDE